MIVSLDLCQTYQFDFINVENTLREKISFVTAPFPSAVGNLSKLKGWSPKKLYW